MLRLIGSLAIVAAGQAAAQTPSCDRLKNSSQPYELVTEISAWERIGADGRRTTMPAQPGLLQVQRGPEGRTTVLSASRDRAMALTSVFVHGALVSTNPRSNARTAATIRKYDTPPTADWRRDGRPFELAGRITFTLPDGTSQEQGFKTTYKPLGGGTIEVGPCRFKKLDYELSTTTSIGEHGPMTRVERVSYAPELGHIVESEALSLPLITIGGRMLSRATDIRDRFEPLRSE